MGLLAPVTPRPASSGMVDIMGGRTCCRALGEVGLWYDKSVLAGLRNLAFGDSLVLRLVARESNKRSSCKEPDSPWAMSMRISRGYSRSTSAFDESFPSAVLREVVVSGLGMVGERTSCSGG